PHAGAALMNAPHAGAALMDAPRAEDLGPVTETVKLSSSGLRDFSSCDMQDALKLAEGLVPVQFCASAPRPLSKHGGYCRRLSRT
ncbi:MAG: hypothetical protein EB017_09495, partial [Betaproteobacteria bacterium]|nr:hypothetical protein [Betaproteobacteria bacterium]